MSNILRFTPLGNENYPINRRYNVLMHCIENAQLLNKMATMFISNALQCVLTLARLNLDV